MISQLRHLGVKDIILDPGIGFAKTSDHNFEIVNRLSEFEVFGLPVLIGLSRKSFIYRSLNVEPKDVLPGTLFLNSIALRNGANILRVHDIRETKQCVELHNLLSSKL